MKESKTDTQISFFIGLPYDKTLLERFNKNKMELNNTEEWTDKKIKLLGELNVKCYIENLADHYFNLKNNDPLNKLG